MSAIASVGVYDDLSAGKSTISNWPADNKSASWVNEVAGVRGQIIGRDDLLNDLLYYILFNILVLRSDCMLCRDDYGVYRVRLAVTVLYRYLTLGIRFQEAVCIGVACLGESSHQLMRE